MTMDKCFSNLNQTQLSALCSKFHITSEFEPRLPGNYIPVHQPPTGMVGVFEEFFVFGNLRLPLRRFFIDILKYHEMHICQLNPLGVSKIISFEMLCRALDISPTIELFRVFCKLAPVGGGRYTFSNRNDEHVLNLVRSPRKWQNKFFFVKIKDLMVMRATTLPVNDFKPNEGTWEQDAEILRRYTFNLGCLPQEILWITGFSNFKCAGDKNPAECPHAEAACLLRYNDYVKKVSTEVLKESYKNTVVGEEQAVSHSKKYHEDETGPSTHLIDEDLAGENIGNVVDHPFENWTDSEKRFFLENLNQQLCEDSVEDTCEVRTEQEFQNYFENFRSVLHVEDPCEKRPERRNSVLEIECDRLRKGKKVLQDEVADYEDRLSHQHFLLEKDIVDYKKKGSEVEALRHTEQLESIELRTDQMTWEAKKVDFYAPEISTLRKKIDEIRIECKKFVDDIPIRFESKEFNEKIRSMCDAFKSQEDELKASEKERLCLDQDCSWLIEGGGIEMVTKQLMNSQEFYAGISRIIVDAISLGIAQGNLEIHNQASPGVNYTQLQSNVDQAMAKIRELMSSCLGALVTFHNQPLQELKQKIPKQSLDDLPKLIARLCDQFSSLPSQ